MRRTAKILKANGTQGGLLISAPDFDAGQIREPVWVEFDSLPVPFFIQECEPRGGAGRYVVRLNDVENLADAQELVGKDLFLDSRGDDADSDAECFLGWSVECRGKELGVISDTEPIPGNPCVYVRTPQGEKMIPLHEDIIISIDPETRRVDMDLPDGLV